MKDLTKEFLMNELNIPKIHGEVDIRLKNPMTGKIVKQIKGENTFQSAVLAKGLRNLGSAKSSFYNDITSVEPWKQIVGGILLFKNSLSNAQYMSKGNKMQANGAYGVTNNSNPPELGSWNDNEYSVSSSAMTLVYDWTTSQANGGGGISSVALTSQVGGYIGYGNPSGTHTATIKTFAEGQGVKSIQGTNMPEYHRRIQIANKLYQFSYNSTDKNVIVRKSHVPITQGSVFDWVMERDQVIDVSEMHYAEVYQQVGSFQAYLDGGKIYLTPQPTYGWDLQVSGKVYIHEYNPSNGELTEIEITNTSGEMIRWNYSSVSYGRFYMYAGGKTHLFDLSDSNYVGYIENYAESSYFIPVGTNFVNGLTIIPYNYDYYRIYDPDNRTCYPTNGIQNFSYQQTPIYYEPETDTLNAYGRYEVYAFNNPLYLATNYNLQSSVQKDATMTMQVRYTLQEA